MYGSMEFKGAFAGAHFLANLKERLAERYAARLDALYERLESERVALDCVADYGAWLQSFTQWLAALDATRRRRSPFRDRGTLEETALRGSPARIRPRLRAAGAHAEFHPQVARRP